MVRRSRVINVVRRTEKMSNPFHVAKLQDSAPAGSVGLLLRSTGLKMIVVGLTPGGITHKTAFAIARASMYPDTRGRLNVTEQLLPERCSCVEVFSERHSMVRRPRRYERTDTSE